MPRHISTQNQSLRGRRVLLVGLGLHGGGEATVRWLVRHGASVRVTDTKTRTELADTLRRLRGVPVVFHLGQNDPPADFAWAELIVANPAVPANKPSLVAAAKRGIPIVNEASLFIQSFPGRLIGVTGTRGKTTTTLLLGHILKRAHRDTIISGNVRQVAMLDYLDRSSATTWAVLELSSFQLERLPVPGRPFDLAVMTNLKVDHLNRHGTLAKYADIKANLFRGQRSVDTAVLNADDQYCRRVAKLTPAKIWWYGRSVPAVGQVLTIRAGWIQERIDGKWKKICSRSRWSLAGGHNELNLMAAVAAARALGVAPATIADAIASFKSVPYRQEHVRTWRGHQFINDTTATSPDGTLACLAVYPRGVYIVGGTDKSLDFLPLAKALARRKKPFVTLPGTATEKLMAAMPAPSRRFAVATESMHEAVHVAVELAKPTEPIVLSPGAASFGLFIHEFDRGDAFCRIVKKLQA